MLFSRSVKEGDLLWLRAVHAAASEIPTALPLSSTSRRGQQPAASTASSRLRPAGHGSEIPPEFSQKPSDRSVQLFGTLGTWGEGERKDPRQTGVKGHRLSAGAAVKKGKGRGRPLP